MIPPGAERLPALPAPLAGVWQGGEKYVIDTASGMLATANTPVEMKKIVVVPSVHTILHWVNKNNPRGAQPASPQNDSQYTLWETPVRVWTAAQNIAEGDRSGIPTTYDTTHGAATAPVLSLTGVDFSTPHTSTERIVLTVTSSGSYALSRVDFFINGQLVEQNNGAPFSFAFTPEDIAGLSAENEVTLVGYDTIFNKGVYSAKLHIQL